MHINPTESWESKDDIQPPLREENARQPLSQTLRAPLLLASCFQQVSQVLLSLHMMLWQNSMTPPMGRLFWQFMRRHLRPAAKWPVFHTTDTCVRAPAAMCRPLDPGDRGRGSAAPGWLGRQGRQGTDKKGHLGESAGLMLNSSMWDFIVQRLFHLTLKLAYFLAIPSILTVVLFPLPPNTETREGRPSGDSDQGLTATRPSLERQVIK